MGTDGATNAGRGADKPLKSSGRFAPRALPSGPSPGAVQRPRGPAAALPCGDGPPAAPAAAAARPGVSAARPRRCLTPGAAAAAAAARGRPTPAPPPPPERGPGGCAGGPEGGGTRRWRGSRDRRDARGARTAGLRGGEGDERGRGGCIGCTEPEGLHEAGDTAQGRVGCPGPGVLLPSPPNPQAWGLRRAGVCTRFRVPQGSRGCGGR